MHTPLIAEPLGRFAGWKSLTWHLAPASPHIGGRVAFLTDARAISSAESVLGYVADLRLGTIVGGPTAGANGNVNSFGLPLRNEHILHRHARDPARRLAVPPGRRAAYGAVEPTLAGIRAGRDEVLERALAIVGDRGR